MSVQLDAVSRQQVNLPPEPQRNDPAEQPQQLQQPSPYVAEPAYHPQFGSLFAANEQGPVVPGGSFADQVRGQSQQPIDRDLALLSQDVYNAEAAGPIGAGNWTRVSDEQLLADGIDPTKLQSDANGMQSAIYTDGSGRYVLAYAGTDPKSLQDWLTNAGQGLGFDTAHYNQAVRLAQDAADAYGDNLVITGHSLGGGVASAASLATNNPPVTFNAAGLSDETIRSLGLVPDVARAEAQQGQIRRYNVENDILTGVQQNGMPLPDALGAELRIDNPYLIKDPLRAHFMDAVLKGMDTGQINEVPHSAVADALERPGEAVLDLAGDATREVIGLVGDAGGVAGELIGNAVVAGQDLINGRPIDAALNLTGDVIEAGLQLTGDVVDRGLNLAGDVVQGAGSVTGGLLRGAGELVGLPGVGNTLGSWAERGGEWLGNGLDTVGGWVESGLDTVGGWVSDGLESAGNWAQDRWNDFKESSWNPGNWF